MTDSFARQCGGVLARLFEWPIPATSLPVSSRVRVCLSLLQVIVILGGIVSPTLGHSSSDEPASFVYIAGALLGAFPADHDAVLQGIARHPTTVRSGIGGAVKVAVFPGQMGGVLGVELESAGQSGGLQFPLVQGATSRAGRSSLSLFSTMANLVLQYPGDRLMPYAGIGLGWATAVLYDTDIPQRPDRGIESASSFGYQFLVGMRARVTPHVFVFSEYQRLAAQFHWKQLALDLTTDHALVGFGYNF